MMTRIRWSVGCAAIVSFGVLSLAPATVFAQGKPKADPKATAPAPAAEPKTPADVKMEEAKQRYQRGLQLYNELNYEAARVEFERAYQLAPSYKILFNIGLAYEQIGDYVQAQMSLQRYLSQGGDEVSADRRAHVEKELNQIRPRIAKVTVRTNAVGAELLVDDACAVEAANQNANCGPLDAMSRTVLMNPGRRRITMRKDGFITETRQITVAGSDQTEVVLNLKPLPKAGVINERNPYMVPAIVGWGVTAAMGIGAGVFGGLALSAESDQKDQLVKQGATQDELTSARDKTQTLATVSDVLLITTGIGAAVSTYFTVRALGWKKPTGPETGFAPREVRVGVTPGGLMAGGTF